MEIKWYGLAELLGLVKDVAYQYNDSYTHYQVSARTDEVFSALTLSLLPALFLAGFLAGRKFGRKTLKLPTAALLVYAVLLAVGVGPYVQLYPQPGGFLDFSTLEHIIEGIYCALLALTLHLGGRLGARK